MISGTRYWQDRSRFDFSQTDNAIEATLRRYGGRVSAISCGPTAAVNCLAAIGHPILTSTYGGWSPQPADVLALWFHDERNWPQLAVIRDATDPRETVYSPNEVPQYYPLAARAVFGADASFEWLNRWDSVRSRIITGQAIQLCTTSPGHYIAVVAYDRDTDELIYHDSYPQRFRDGGDGFARRMSHEQYRTDVQPFAVVYRRAA